MKTLLKHADAGVVSTAKTIVKDNEELAAKLKAGAKFEANAAKFTLKSFEGLLTKLRPAHASKK